MPKIGTDPVNVEISTGIDYLSGRSPQLRKEFTHERKIRKNHE